MKSNFLGKTVEDAITGLRGVVTGHVLYITGCSQLLVQPKCKPDGDHVQSHWFDEDRCQVIVDTPVDLPRKNDGADKPAPRR